MSPAPDPDRFLTVDEVADRWLVSRKTIMRLLKRGELPYFCIGRQIRVRHPDLLAYENKRSK